MEKLALIWLFILNEGVLGNTGYEYNPQNNGSSITYMQFDVGGVFRWDEMRLPIIWRWAHTALPVATVKALDCVFPCYLKATIYVTDYGVYGNKLYDANCQNGGIMYLGEVGNPEKGWLVLPGEPKLPYAPYVGEEIETDHEVTVTAGGQVQGSRMHTTFWVVDHGAWGIFPDCWMTCLIERPEGPDPAVYWYVYAKGIGLVDLYWGHIDLATGNVGTPQNP